MQGVHDNYDIDIFQALLTALSKIVNCDDLTATAMRVIVDHIRATCFLIADGITPSNEGRGYVLRRIIRRAARYGFKLGMQKPFFYRMAAPLAKIMGDAYPSLTTSLSLIEQVIQQEEKQFANTLSKGLKILDRELTESTAQIIDGQLMFQLYDTYGFPPDLTIDIAKERNLQWDVNGFEALMLKQREQSQQFAQFNADQTQQIHLTGETLFTGYEKIIDEGRVTTLLHDFKPVTQLQSGEKGMVILDKTPFYAESGGQVGDTGYLYFNQGSFCVHDTQKKGSVILHQGQMISGVLLNDMTVCAEVSAARQSTRLNHSATHLLHEALRRVLGNHVVQKGSLVEPKRLRFDFSHPASLTQEQITATERLINQQICANLSLSTKTVSLEQAKSEGAMALFSEKYADQVRVVSIAEFSTEICGGTHVTRTGDIGLFKIISESACAAGVRRIEAVTGSEALHWIESSEKQLQQLSALLKVGRDSLYEKLAQVIDHNKQMSKELASYKQKMAVQNTDQLLSRAKKITDIHVLIETVSDTDRERLRHTIDQLKQQLGKSIILLASIVDGKIILITSVSKECLSKITAPDLLKAAGGKGGGRPDLAQGGADDLSQLQNVMAWVENKVV